MDKWIVYILLAVCLPSYGQANGNKQVKQGTDSLQNDTIMPYSVDSLVHNYMESGRVKSENGDKLGAIAEYNKVIEIDSNYAVAYYKRGNQNADLGKNEDAITDYNKAIEINPDYAFAYSNRGTVKAALGDHTGAITDYNKAIEIKPDFALAYSNRGKALSLSP